MFHLLIYYFKSLDHYNGAVEFNVNVLTSHFMDETPRMREIFKKINLKYDFGNYKNIVDTPSLDTHIELWRDSGQFNLSLHLADLNGVYEADSEFGQFYDFYESNVWENFEPYANEQAENLFYDLHYDLFYTWIALLWQELHHELGGFSIKLLENNATSIFNLIDFAWFDNSPYNDFSDQPFRRTSYFNRALNIQEIYSRIKIPFRMEMNCSRILKKENMCYRLSIDSKCISLKNEVTDELLESHPLERITYNNAVSFVKKHNELLNNNWADITFERQAGIQ